MSQPPTAIARRLSRGQRSAVLNMDPQFCVLGCSEPWAIRLKAERSSRPALVKEGERSPEGWRTFALTATGLAVRAVLLEQKEH